IRSFQFIKEALTDKTDKQVQEIVGEGHVDDDVVRSIVTRLGVFILTDSFLMNTELSYKVARGDTLWSIFRKFHGGIPPGFGTKSRLIAEKNSLPSPDEIRSGDKIKLRWYGLRSGTADEDIALY